MKTFLWLVQHCESREAGGTPSEVAEFPPPALLTLTRRWVHSIKKVTSSPSGALLPTSGTFGRPCSSPRLLWNAVSPGGGASFHCLPLTDRVVLPRYGSGPPAPMPIMDAVPFLSGRNRTVAYPPRATRSAGLCPRHPSGVRCGPKLWPHPGHDSARLEALRTWPGWRSGRALKRIGGFSN